MRTVPHHSVHVCVYRHIQVQKYIEIFCFHSFNVSTTLKSSSVLCLWPKWDVDSWIRTDSSLLHYSTPAAGWFLDITGGFVGRVTCYLSTQYLSQPFRWSGPWTLALCWATVLFSVLCSLNFFVKRDQTESLVLISVLCIWKWKLCYRSFA